MIQDMKWRKLDAFQEVLIRKAEFSRKMKCMHRGGRKKKGVGGVGPLPRNLWNTKN